MGERVCRYITHHLAAALDPTSLQVPMATHTDEPSATDNVVPEHILPQALKQDRPVTSDTTPELQDVAEGAFDESHRSHSSSPVVEQYSADYHSHSDGSEEEEGALGQSMEGGEVGLLLRATVEALETELKVIFGTW